MAFVLGEFWALPWTLPAALALLVLWAAGQARPRVAPWLWETTPGHALGDWMLRRRGHPNAWTAGTVTLFRSDIGVDDERVAAHEAEHRRQARRLGPFLLPLWVIAWVLIRWGCPELDTYWDHPFETDARRAAGEWPAWRAR